MIRIETNPMRVDWFQVLADLRRAGVPVSSVSQEIRVPQSTILGWRQGAEPKFLDGEKLLILWSGTTGHERASVPRTGTLMAAQRAALPV